MDIVQLCEVGMLIAVILFMKRMSEESGITGWEYYDADEDPDGPELKAVPKHVRVYEISGPMFFGDADRLAGVNFKDYTRVIIIRMRGVPALDATAMHAMDQLFDRCKERNIKMVFSHVNEQPFRTMEKSGFIEKVGRENFRPHIDDALAWAAQLESDLETQNT